jgi:tRNA A37 threonylcarbamoyladenosine biosynthesis protein TsaE
MKIVKTNLKFKDLGTKPFAIETAPEHIKLHSVSLLVGKRGSGKSFFASNLLDWLDFDRIIIVSPTYDSNYAQFKRLGVAKEDIFDPDDPMVIQKIIHIVNTERDELVEYRQKLKMLKELKEIIKHPYDLTENYHLFNEFITFDGKWIQPKHKWGGRKPKIGVFVDDAQSTRIFRNRHFLNLCTRSRHIGSFEGEEASIGISLFIACQNYTATGGGLPRAVRGNATHMALWRTKNKDELNLIAKEMAGEVSPEKFIEVYNYIMSDEEDRHVFMFIDLHKKDNHPSMFRKNYTDFVVM